MPLPGRGFIALWNDIAPDRADYNVWHTIEHVPQRMTVDGFLRACRYTLIEGALPRFFTLYALRELTALESEAYQALVHHPTPWSRAMRPDMSDFIRRVCSTRLSRGGGVGGFLAVALGRHAPDTAAEQACDALLGSEGVSSVHLGGVHVDAAPFAALVRRGELPFEPQSLLLIEGYDARHLKASCAAPGPAAAGFESWAFYKLVFELRKEDLAASGLPRSDVAHGPGRAEVKP